MGQQSKNATKSVRRRHVWQSFSVRIEQVHIDGARIKRQSEMEEKTESYFLGALQKWTELNQTIPFTEFLKEVERRSQSLAQIVHHQVELFDALLSSISRGDPLSLEALLDLLVQFIRDLNVDFEPFVPRTVATLVPLTRHSSVEVIESTFTTFTYLFKYLQKPLSANPLPVFDAFATLLGRDSPQKPYIVRFAAESLSFLMRQTRSRGQTHFIEHIFSELRVRHSSEFIDGMSVLVAETVKSVDHALHFRGLEFLKNLVSCMKADSKFLEQEAPEVMMLENVTINLLHHCHRGTFVEVLALFSECMLSKTYEERDFGWRMCFICCAVRKATRIQDFLPLLTSLQSSMDDPTNTDISNAAKLATVLYTYAPHQILLATNTAILKSLARHDLAFLSFAGILAKQNMSHFSTFVLATYRKTINDHWAALELSTVSNSLICLSKLGAFNGDSGSVTNKRLRLQDKFCETVLSRIESLPVSTTTQAELNALVTVTGAVTCDQQSCTRSLSILIDRCISHRKTGDKSRNFALLLGSIFDQLSKFEWCISDSLISVLSSHTGLWTSSAFLRGFCVSVARNPSQLPLNGVVHLLLNNLSGPGHFRRLHSLQILQKIDMSLNPTERDMLSVCEIIESTDLTMDATRSLAIHIRKINHTYPLLKHDLCKEAIVRYSMGLMTGNYTPFWEMCSETLSIAAKTEPDLVWGLTYDWFDHENFSLGCPETVENGIARQSTIREAGLDSFRCFNCAELLQNSLNIHQQIKCPLRAANESYAEEANTPDEHNHVGRRLQALRICSAIPDLAAHHSDQIVPVFLQQVGNHVEDDDEETEANENVVDMATSEADVESVQSSSEHKYEAVTSDSIHSGSRFGADKKDYSKKERNDLLKLFTKFQNPAALSQSQAVRDVILELLASRDSRTQSMAFETLLHYRDQFLKLYEDHLRNLLSETRSRDEITTFLQTDADDTIIQEEHRKHVIPVVARILYGKMINRRHAGSQKKGLSNSRNVVLGAIASMPKQDIAEFVSLFLRSFTHLTFVDKSSLDFKLRGLDLQPVLSIRKQVGFCTMIQDAVQQLAGKIQPFVSSLLDALIFCFVSAQGLLETVETEDFKVSFKIARNIRHSVLQSLDLLFKYCRQFEWAPYMDIIFEHFVLPRLDKLSSESSQSPSVLLKLLGNWASSSLTSPLLVRNGTSHILRQIFSCLAQPSVKAPVITFVLEMIQTLSDQVKDGTNELNDLLRSSLLPDQVEFLLDNMTTLLENQQASSTNNTIPVDLLQLEISVLTSVSTFVKGGGAIQKLLNLLMPLLQKPRRLVQDTVKEGILQIVEHLLPYSEDYLANTDSLWLKYNTIGSLFATSSSRQARKSLSKILEIFATKDESLVSVTCCIEELNSYSNRRLDTPDFDRRLAAFARLNQEQAPLLGPKAWRPLIYTLIYFIGDEEELALRTNATYSINRFLEVVSFLDDQANSQYVKLLESDLYPAIKKGMRHKTEVIRQEWVSLLGNLVKTCSFWGPVQDLVPLLVGGDEEANFFNNVMHIQLHRRMRALRRLVSVSRSNKIQSNNIAQLLLPLIEHYCFAPKADSHNLIAETIKTIGSLSHSLKFNQYCALLKRYIDLLKLTDITQPTVVRLIGATVDAFVGTPEVTTILVDHLYSDDNSPEGAIEGKVDAESCDTAMPDLSKQSELQLTQPEISKVHDMVANRFLPPLSRYLNAKDDDTVNLRIPIALTVVKLLASLPQDALTMRLPGVLSDVCHILRSRSQDARDMTRKTLGMIATLLGPRYFSYILAELKVALQRGYQLHVLGFSVHTILVKLEPELGSLDYCLTQIVDILMDDIFGETGLEKEAEEYITKMKEMKSTKSFDSFEILASTTTIDNLGELLWSLKTLLTETSSPKVIRKVDEVLRRLTLGTLRNKSCNSRDVLQFCFNVYQETLNSTQKRINKKLSIQEQAREDSDRNFVVDLKARKTFQRNHSADNAHKLYKFSLETLRAILQKHTTLQTPENLAAFIPLAGDSLMSGLEEVHIQALRLLTQIIKLDLPTIDSGAPVFLEQAVGFIRRSPTTNTELCQAALKFLSAILKERQNVSIKDSILAYVLLRIKADIEEPDRQGITFSLLRSIMYRKFMVPELYDIMDEVARMMITNQSSGPRDTARSAYYQFLTTYPQGKGRLKRQIAFLVKNLEYDHASGRQSVMEALNLIITHFDDSLLQEYIQMLHMACTMSLVNDDDSHCRELAAALLKKLIERADQERLSSITTALRSWAYDERLLLQRASLQGFGFLFDVKGNRQEDSRFFTKVFTSVVKSQATNLNTGHDEDVDELTDPGWELLYFGLQTFSKLVQLNPVTFISTKFASLWTKIPELLLYRHTWVRLSSARLVGIVFANMQLNRADLLFVAGKDLSLQDIDLVRLGRQSLIQLRSSILSQELGTQIVKNLLFLLRIFHEKGVVLPPRDDTVVDEAEEPESVGAPSCVEWLVKRVATLLQSDRDVKRETHLLVRRLLIQFLTATIGLVSVETLTRLSLIIAKPLYKYAEMQTHTDAQSSIKDLSVETFEILKQKLGQTQFASVYNSVRQAQLELRQDRRIKRTIEAVKDPEKRAGKKVKAGMKKKEKRAEVARDNKRRRELRSG